MGLWCLRTRQGALLTCLWPSAFSLALLRSSVDSELSFFETKGGLGEGFQNSDVMAQAGLLRGASRCILDLGSLWLRHSKKRCNREGRVFVGQLIKDDLGKWQLPFPSRAGVFKSHTEVGLNTSFPTS